MVITREDVPLPEKFKDRLAFVLYDVFTEDVSSVVTIVADYQKIVAEGNNQRQSIVSFHNRLVAENSGIFGIKSTRTLTDSYPGQPVPRKSTRNHIREVNS